MNALPRTPREIVLAMMAAAEPSESPSDWHGQELAWSLGRRQLRRLRNAEGAADTIADLLGVEPASTEDDEGGAEQALEDILAAFNDGDMGRSEALSAVRAILRRVLGDDDEARS